MWMCAACLYFISVELLDIWGTNSSDLSPNQKLVGTELLNILCC